MKRPALFYAYLVLAVAGLVGTWTYNILHISAGGSFAPHVAFANALTGSLTIDVLVAALTFSVWVVVEGRRAKMRWPVLYVVLCWTVALAFAWPLFLALRESKRAPA